MQAQEVQFKLIVAGDGGVGKGQYLRNFLPEGAQQHNFDGNEVYPLTFHTNRGVMNFNVWNTAGQQQFGGLRDGFYIQGQCALIMFDTTSRITYKNVHKWCRDIRRVCENIPIVLVGNKADIKDRKVKQKQISISKKMGIRYFDLYSQPEHMSVWNLGGPFLHLARTLSGDDELEFVDFPVPFERNPPFLAGLSVDNALDRIVTIHNSGQTDRIQKKQHYYDFLYWNAPAWKDKLKDLDFFSQLAQVAKTHPEAWKQLFWNLLCNFSTTAPVLPSGGSIVPSLLHLCMEAALGDLSMVKYYCQIKDEELLVQHCQLICKKQWLRKEMLEDADLILRLSEIGREHHDSFWELLVDNLLCPPMFLPWRIALPEDDDEDL